MIRAGWITALLALPLLSACALSPVSSTTRDEIEKHVHPGMTLSDARAEMEGMHYRCRTGTGSYFDENGDEHDVDTPFVSCIARPEGWFSFQCDARTHVVLVPNGDRVGNLVIDKAPSCVKPD